MRPGNNVHSIEMAPIQGSLFFPYGSKGNAVLIGGL